MSKPPKSDSMRGLINLVERYTEDNGYLLRYMGDESFDPFENWWAVCRWLEKNDHLDEVSAVLGHEVEDSADLEEEDPEIFAKLPDWLQKAAAKGAADHVMRYDPAEASSKEHMSLRTKKLLPRSTWLVHFTDDPYGITRSGFTIGMSDVTKLGLTTHFSNDGYSKKDGGYNFAFLAQSREARNAASDGKYGKHAVLFQNSGVHVYHYGDEENQIVFWGRDVDPRGVIGLRHDDGDWVVEARQDTRRGNDVLFRGEFSAAVQWVITNYAQYRRALTAQ